MSNFHDTEMAVIRHAEEKGSITNYSPTQYLEHRAIAQVHFLCNSIAKGEPVAEISDAMGRTIIDLIILCAMLDIDLSKCLEQAFEKIIAKPEASNVLFLKKE